jgi:microcystin-dependent protein
MDYIILTNNNQNLCVNNKYISPVGAITCYAGANEPEGWLFCDGSEVSKETYSSLFSVVGNNYGSPIDSNNFVLPNLTQKFPLGKSGSNNLGNSSGNSTITLTNEQLPSHTHTGTTDASGIHSHTATDSGHNHPYVDAYFAEANAGIQNNVYGTSAATDNDNEYVYRTVDDGTPLTSTAYANITIGNSGSHTHTFTTNSTGSNSSINIMNPYLVLNYIIKY